MMFYECATINKDELLEAAMIDVKLLTLLKVFETGNYTRAAEQLALTQPAVSQHIKQIEKVLGITLFVRSGGKFRPTRRGRW